MKERILVPLDGTPTGEAVLPHLESLVLNGVPGQDAELTLLRVISVINFNVLTTDERAQLAYSDEDRDELFRKANAYLEGAALELRRKGFQVKTEVKIGHAAKEIVDLANEIGANLIAMSTHGRAGIIRWVKGSVTDEVIGLENRIPVLTIRVGRQRNENSIFSLRSLQTILKYV